MSATPVDSRARRLSIRRWLGAVDDESGRSTLSLRRYALFSGLGLATAALQLLLMSRFLSAREFGLLVLSISATQGILQIGDLGVARVCIDVARSPEERAQLRAEGQSLTELTTALLVVVAGILMLVYSGEQRAVPAALALGGLAAVAVAADKFRATRHEVAGDQTGAAALNFLWTNAPKIGLVAGLLVFRRALWIAAVGAVVAALMSAPSWTPLRFARSALQKARTWVPTVVAIVASFLLIWSDTYFLAAHLGVAEAGDYEALYRILGICTYVFMPWTSVLTSRVSVEVPRPLTRPLVLSMVTTAMALAGAVAVVWWLAPQYFPDIDMPHDAIPGLLVFYMLMPVSFLLGLALYVRSGTVAVAKATAVGALVGIAGHVMFTLRGGPTQAALVQACALGVAVALQSAYYRRTIPRV